MSKITGINHITLAVSKLTQSIHFYAHILELKLVAEWERGAYLLAGDLWLCLTLDPNTRENTLPEYTHIAFNLAEADFTWVESKVKSFNIPVWKENTSHGKSVYILDPDGHKLEVHTSNLADRVEQMKKCPYSHQKLYS